MSTTLYRKYRPQTFSEIIGQKHIIQTLTNALAHDRLSHAYLFTGPRGTGKTTLARILAKSLNCSDRKKSGSSRQNLAKAEPCLKCPHCLAMAENRSLDIIEIDAASNTGVDNIRELRETVKLPPSLGTHKVYIIDEVHMLSQGAWNALLKTLEEPPAHAVFILATTELHKIPETILSRCQRFDFTRLPFDHIIEKLARIAKDEKVKVDQEALEMIALSAEGGMRDAESLLAQVISLEDKHVTTEEAGNILGITTYRTVETFTQALADRDFGAALDIIKQLSTNGFDCYAFATRLLHHFRKVLLVSVDPKLADSFAHELTTEQLDTLRAVGKILSPTDSVRLVELFQAARKEIRLSPISELPLEVAAVKFIYPDARISGTTTPGSTKPPAPSVTPSAPVRSAAPTQASPAQAAKTASSADTAPAVESETTVSLDAIVSAWSSIAEIAKRRSPSLGLALVGARPLSAEGKTVTLSAQFSIHKDQLTQAKNQLTLVEAFDTILKIRPVIRVVLEEKTEPEQATDADALMLTQALDMLGGRVVS